MPFGKTLQAITDRCSHRHSYKVSVDDNPLCADRVTDKLHNAKLRHSYCIQAVDTYLKAIKTSLKETIKKTAKKRGEIEGKIEHLRGIVNRQREQDYMTLSEFIVSAKKLDQKILDAQVKQMQQAAQLKITKELDDPITEIEFHGEKAPNRSKIIQYLANVKKEYLSQVSKDEKALRTKIESKLSKEEKLGAIDKFNDTINKARRLIIDELCPRVKVVVSTYQGAISKEAIKRQDKQAKINLAQSTFKVASDTLGELKVIPGGAIAAAIATAASGLFDILNAYQGMKEPVVALQSAAKFLVEVVLKEAQKVEEFLISEHGLVQQRVLMYDKRVRGGLKALPELSVSSVLSEMDLSESDDEEFYTPRSSISKDDHKFGSDLSKAQWGWLNSNNLQPVYIAKDGRCLFQTIGTQLGSDADKLQQVVLKKLQELNNSKLADKTVKQFILSRKKDQSPSEFIKALFAAVQKYDWTKPVYDEVPGLIVAATGINLTIIRADGKPVQLKGGGKTVYALYTTQKNHYHSVK